MPDGHVLVAGGSSDGQYLVPVQSYELFDPSADTWTYSPSQLLTYTRQLHTATILPSGKVLVAGGYGVDDEVPIAELYDPGTVTPYTGGKPTLDSLNSTTVCLGTDYVGASGSGFEGLSECSGGNGGQNSSTNYPLLQIHSLADDSYTYLQVDPAHPWSDISFRSLVVGSGSLTPGEADASIVTNGIASDPIAITIYAPPAITGGTPADPAAICSGSTATLTVTSTGTGLSYQWYRGAASDTSDPVGTDSASYTTDPLSSSTSYWARVTGTCSADSRTATVPVNELPAASSVTGGGSYCSGGSGVAVGLSGSETGVNYQLYNDASPAGSPVAGTGSAISFGSQTAAGTYTVAATNATTSCTANMTGSATVTVDACTPYRVPSNVTPTSVSTDSHGTDVTVTWDASNCASINYHIIYGKGENLSAWTLDGGKCAIGTSGTYTWNGLPDPTSYTKRFLWFLVVGDNGIGTEGSWGLTSEGTEEGGTSASSVCSMTTKDLSGTCP